MVQLSSNWKNARLAPVGSPIRTPIPTNSEIKNQNCSLSQLRAHYYDTTTAEFISPDPLKYVDGMSFFRGYFVGVGVDPNGKDVYAIDGTWADESQNAVDAIKTGYSNVHQFYLETTEEKHYWGGPGTNGWAIVRFYNGALGQDIYLIIRDVKAQICSDYCEKKDSCEELEINLVSWSR